MPEGNAAPFPKQKGLGLLTFRKEYYCKIFTRLHPASFPTNGKIRTGRDSPTESP